MEQENYITGKQSANLFYLTEKPFINYFPEIMRLVRLPFAAGFFHPLECICYICLSKETLYRDFGLPGCRMIILFLRGCNYGKVDIRSKD